MPFIASFSQRFASVDYSVCNKEFAIKADYDKDKFLIDQYVCKLLESLQKVSCTGIAGQFIDFDHVLVIVPRKKKNVYSYFYFPRIQRKVQR